MPRLTILDYLQINRFTLLDMPQNISGKDLLSGLTGMVFVPFFGFNSISGPQRSAVVDEIPVGIGQVSFRYIKSWEHNAITITRGMAFQRFEMQRWIKQATNGNYLRKSFLLVHSSNQGLDILPAWATTNNIGGAFTRIPAKAWVLSGCIPTRYKVADFEATTAEIAVEELDIDAAWVEPIDIMDGLKFLSGLFPTPGAHIRPPVIPIVTRAVPSSINDASLTVPGDMYSSA